MQKVIISDNSCLILLKNINRTSILNSLFGNVLITDEIAREYGIELPGYITVENPKEINYTKILQLSLGKGESSAIALALEKNGCLLIVDDSKARREAKYLVIEITGTIGVLINAKMKGIINSIREVFDEIDNTDFRISDELKIEALKICGEK